MTSTHIYPYVYKCIHKETGEFYIGYRCANKVPSHIDLPQYRTSSKKVKPRFVEFNWQIIAEFFDKTDAYWFEQSLIKENWNDPLLLNDKYQDQANGNESFRHIAIGWKHSEETKNKIRQGHLGKPKGKQTKEHVAKRITKDSLAKMAETKRGRKGHPMSPEHKEKLRQLSKGRKQTPEQIHARISKRWPKK